MIWSDRIQYEQHASPWHVSLVVEEILDFKVRVLATSSRMAQPPVMTHDNTSFFIGSCVLNCFVEDGKGVSRNQSMNAFSKSNFRQLFSTFFRQSQSKFTLEQSLLTGAVIVEKESWLFTLRVRCEESSFANGNCCHLSISSLMFASSGYLQLLFAGHFWTFGHSRKSLDPILAGHWDPNFWFSPLESEERITLHTNTHQNGQQIGRCCFNVWAAAHKYQVIAWLTGHLQDPCHTCGGRPPSQRAGTDQNIISAWDSG